MIVALVAAPAAGQEVRGPESPTPTSKSPSPAATLPDRVTTTEDAGLADIVVTARKIAENLQDVPVAVTAFSGEALQQQNARQVADVALLTPSLIIREAPSAGSAVTFQLRGQYQNDILATLDPSVGVYVDGYYWARAYGINANLLDVQSVQTLKGPQGTLFGRNTTGGAILLQTNDPNFNGISGLVSGTYGRFDYKSGTAVVNLPILADKIALRAAYEQTDSNGFVTETNTGRRLGEHKEWTARVKLLLKPTDNFSLLLSAEQYRTNYQNNPFRIQYVSPTSLANLEPIFETRGAGALACFASPAAEFGCLQQGNQLYQANAAAANSGDRLALNALPQTYAKTQTYTGTATLDTFFGAIKFIGGYRNVRALADIDLDGSQYNTLATRGFQNLDQLSGELQVTGKALANRLDFAAGAFYFHESGSDQSYSSGLPALNPTIQNFQGQIRTRSQGLYGQATYHLTDKLSLTGGLRYSVEDKGLTANNGIFTAGTYQGPATGAIFVCALTTCPASNTNAFEGVSYTASVDYKLTSDVLLYAKTAKGFRSGGQNLRATNSIPNVASFTPFKPEIATSYESGLKSEFFDRHLRLNIAGYYTRVNDIQRSTLVSDGAGNQATVLGNAGKVDIYGGELEAEALLYDGFRLSGTAAYTRPKYVSYIDPVTGFDRSHEQFADTPRWTFSVSPSFTHAFSFGRFLLRADYTYTSSNSLYPIGYYVDGAGITRNATDGTATDPAVAAGILKATRQDAFALVNARASLTVLDDKLEVALFGRNLTDNRGKVVALPIPGLDVAAAILREPRTFGVSATFRFGGK